MNFHNTSQHVRNLHCLIIIIILIIDHSVHGCLICTHNCTVQNTLEASFLCPLIHARLCYVSRVNSDLSRLEYELLDVVESALSVRSINGAAAAADDEAGAGAGAGAIGRC
jgi:hypothetical protein